MGAAVLIAILALGAIFFYVFRMFRLEKVEVPVEEPAAEPVEALEEAPPPPEDAPEKADLFNLLAEEDMNLNDLITGAAQFDPLCSLKTGAAFLNDCRRALAQGGTWAAACMDFDRFNYINALKGVSIGDYVLANMAIRIQEIFPPESLVTRLTADHFAVLFPMAYETALEGYVEELRRTAEKIRSDIGSKSGLRLRVGVCVNHEGERDPELLLTRADLARHCLKASKAETLSIYDSAMATTLLYGERAMESYRDYQYDEQVVPYFLPQSDITINRIVAAQALSRWNFEDVARKDHPVTAENGRPPSGGGRMVYHACRTISRWRKSGKEVLPVFVYLPATELYKSDIDEYIAKCAAEFQLEASMITPVVDISTLLVAPDTAKAQLQKLHDIGVKLCVEGNIYEQGRPELLKDYPLSFVKFSRALTAGIEKNPERLDYLSSLHKKYDAMGIRAVFEGIDETSHMNTVRAIGGILVEGRYAGRAVSGDDFSYILQEFIHKQRIISTDTIILDDKALQQGDFNVY